MQTVYCQIYNVQIKDILGYCSVLFIMLYILPTLYILFHLLLNGICHNVILATVTTEFSFLHYVDLQFSLKLF